MGKGRSSPCCDKSKVRTGPWSSAEDYVLVNFIRRYGHTNWRALPRQAGLLRCGKSCRLRWINYLRPGVKRGNFTPEEEQTIINMHNSIGKKWSKIASCLPGRTDSEIKNVWNSHLKKRLVAKINNSDDDDEAKESTKLMQYCSSISSAGSSSITAITSGDHHPDQNYYMEKSPNSNCSSNLNFFKASSNNIITSSDDDHRKIEILSLMTSDFDYNFWELLEPLENDDEYDRKVSVTTYDQEKLDGGEEELRKSLRFLENELGLANHDQDDDDNAGQQMTINFKPQLDCSTLRHLGI